MFVDEVTIEVTGGPGGDGCASLLREKSKPKGGPDGGDGGDGGSVYVVLDSKLQSLQKYKNRTGAGAGRGNPGMKFNKHGKDGADLELGVPPGTIVTDEESGEELGEISETLSRLLVARGGRGGRGNQHFATSRNQTPRRADDGTPGEERALRLSYFIRADAALVGLANSGKSALAAALSGSDFAPASHPFSTRQPTPLLCALAPWLKATLLDLPSVRPPGQSARERENRFLRHLRNPRLILYILDAASETAPARQLEILRDAVSEYIENTREKKEMLIVTRTDIADPKVAIKISRKAIHTTINDMGSIEKVRSAITKLLEN